MRLNFCFLSGLFCFLLLGFYQNTWSQVKKFGEIDVKSFETKAYDLDTSVNAVILFELGKSYFEEAKDGGINLIYERHTRIRILKKSGYDKANIEIPFYFENSKSREFIDLIKAASYKKDGENIVRTDINLTDIFEESINQNYKQKKFTIPNIQEGAIIEYSYRITSEHDGQIREWHFQSDIPTIWSEYKVTLPEFYDYKPLFQGVTNFYSRDKQATSFYIKSQSFNATYYRWAVKNVPAFQNEKYITSAKDYISKVDFQLNGTYFQGIYKPHINSWEDINKKLLAHPNFGEKLINQELPPTLVKKLIKDIDSLDQKIRVIYNYVRDNIKWNQSKGIFAKNSAKKTLDLKSGNVAEINFLLILLLREAKIYAHPVVLSTRNNGKPNRFLPLMHRLNYLIAYVQIGNKEYLLDATQPLLPMGMLDYHVLNGQGRSISVVKANWINLQTFKGINRHTNIEVNLDKEATMIGEINTLEKDYAAFDTRQMISKLGEAKYVEDMWKKENIQIKVDEYKFENLADIQNQLKIHLKIKVDNQIANDRIYIEPYLIKSFNDNPFKPEERRFPIDFAYTMSDVYFFKINLPPDYEVEELPKNINFTNSDQSAYFTYFIEKKDNAILLRSRLGIDKTVYLPEEYKTLRELFSLIIAKQSEQIVLKKINKP